MRTEDGHLDVSLAGSHPSKDMKPGNLHKKARWHAVAPSGIREAFFYPG
jgi:hypothetical protein